MHEVSIALSLLDIVAGQCKKDRYNKVEAVNVRIGRASGILPDALVFAFDVVKSDTVAHDAVLRIEEVPVGGHCEDCCEDFTVEGEYVLACPRCGSGSFKMTSGRELDIVDMEVSE